MSGWCPTRSEGWPAAWARFGAILLLLPSALVAEPAPAWADDAPEAEQDGEDEDERDDEQDEGEAPVPGETVDVSTTRLAEQERAHEAPESVFVIELGDETPPGTTAAEVLDDIPGVRVRRLGGTLAPAFVQVRGSSSQQVAVFVDGVPLNGFGSAAVDLSELAVDAYDRLELFRGLAPSHLGGAAMGGAVHLVTDLERSPAPRFEAGYGSWDTRHVSAAGGRSFALPGGGRGQLRAWVGYAGTRGDFPTFTHNGTLYNRSDDRIVPRANNHEDTLSGRALLRLRRGPAELSLLEQATWSGGGVPGAYYARTLEAGFDMAQNLLHAQLGWRLSDRARLDAGLGWRARWEAFDDPRGEVGTGIQADRSHFHNLHASLGAALRPVPWLQLRPHGRAEVALQRAVSLIPEPESGPLRHRVGAHLAMDARALPLEGRIELRGSLAMVLIDGRSLAEEGDGGVVVEPTPGLALALRPLPWLTVRGAVSRGVRPPTMLELFGSRGTIIGNPDLQAERGVQVDGGLRLSPPDTEHLGGSLELGAFARWSDDLIVFVPNAQRVSVPQNLGATRLVGLEGAASLRALGFLDMSAAATHYLLGEIVEDVYGLAGNRIPNLPLWQVDLQVGVHYRDHVRLTWSFAYTAGTYDSPSNYFEQAARPLHDLTLRLQPHPRWPWVALELRNLADRIAAPQYRNPLEPREDDRTVVALQDFRGHPLPGRSALVTVGWTFLPPAPARSQP